VPLDTTLFSGSKSWNVGVYYNKNKRTHNECGRLLTSPNQFSKEIIKTVGHTTPATNSSETYRPRLNTYHPLDDQHQSFTTYEITLRLGREFVARVSPGGDADRNFQHTNKETATMADANTLARIGSILKNTYDA
jgi:hypothetical protein